MKWITEIFFVVLSIVLNHSVVLADLNNVETFPITAGGLIRRDGRGGSTSVVYGCNAGNEVGPCVDTPSLCTSQGGKFVGYCFVNGKYEGVCCPGLNPANSTLTTKPPSAHDDSTPNPLPTFPEAPSTPSIPPTPSTQAPTMTTQSLPPTPTTQTMPPAPTMTTQSLPPTPTTQTMPPAPTMTTQSLPPTPTTQTMPPAPTMTTDTMPPAPTMTTQSLPPTPTTQTMPPAPTMTTDTMPPAPTMTTQSLPPTPTTQTMPPAPTMTTESVPPVPSFPTNPPPPSPPAVHDDTTTANPVPTMPSVTTQTMPAAPSTPTMPPAPTTQTPPPAPTMTTQTMPPAPTTQTMPPAPTMTTQTMPPNPTMTTDTVPPAPTMTTQTMPPGPTTQTMPPAPTMTTQTMPPGPTMTTDTVPPAPTMTTQTMPPGPTTQTMPPAPTMTTQTMPPNPTMTTETPPTAPTMTTQTMPPAPTMTTQTAPPAPTMTTQTVPPAPSIPTQTTPAPPSTNVLLNSSNTFPSFPSMTTQSPPAWNFTTQSYNFTTQSLNFTTQSLNFTTQHMNFTTQSFNMTTQSLNFTTQAMGNMTMTTIAMPQFPTTTESTTTAATEATTTAATAATDQITTGTSEAPPPAFDVPGGEVWSCGPIISDIESLFQNPSYPSLDTEPNVFEYTVIPQDGYCALRIEFLEALLAGKGMEGCSTDSVVVVNSGDTPTTPVCGLLQGYEFTTKTLPEEHVKIVVTTQSAAYLWSINVTQIQCNAILPYSDYESPDCGIKNPKPAPAGLAILSEEPKVVPATKLLKSKRKSLRDIMPVPPGPAKLLQNAVLNRESSIKIVRGNETGINEYPWQALLMINGRPVCGASVISDQFVITAGHCVSLNLRYPLVSVMTVDLGDHDLRTTKETKSSVLRIAKIIPNIQNEGLRNDIALIKLATKIPFTKNIRPVCLPAPGSPASTYAGETGITTGWGRTEDSVISPVLREASVPILTNEKCRQQWTAVGEGGGSLIESTNICVGGGDVGPCNGDSGGPLVIQQEDRWRLVGLTSFGSLRGCGLPSIPSVYVRITSYVDWIALNLAAT